MMGYTHAAIGAATGLGIALVGGAPPLEALGMAGLASFAALLPDIDHPRSSIRQRIGFVGHVLLWWLPHRGVTHTLLVLNIGVILVHLVGLYLHTPIPHQWALVGGYASHIVADMLTKDGLSVLWPFYRVDLHLLPKPLRIRTGGFIEFLVFMGVIGLSVLVMREIGLPSLGELERLWRVMGRW